MIKQLRKSYVPLEVIEDQLLVALDDKSKVAVVLDCAQLELLVKAIGGYPFNAVDGFELLRGLRQLQTAAFGAAEAGGK